MYSREHRKLIDKMSALGGVRRRQLLQSASVVGLAALSRPTAVLAESDDDERATRAAREEAHNICHQHRFGEFSDWSEPINLGPIVNSNVDDFHPAISNDGLSLYISSARPGGFGPNDIWVSQRDSLDDPWGPPQNLGPNINSAGDDFAPDFSPDGHLLFFSSGRPPGTRDATQIWVSYRKDPDDDFDWRPAVNLGPDINLPGVDDNAPTFFQDHKTGITSIYFNSSLRKDGPGDFDIYVSTQRPKMAHSVALRLSKSSAALIGIPAPPSAVTVWKCSSHPIVLADRAKSICGSRRARLPRTPG